ncbi:serine [Echinococcus multilocularis]|uniref:Serine n=1 Tax=Echinococcus multilocularis TaxID=6211 RepID=A0A0S4MI04_ECHMU|nr:serine [Echinococcus multilocularis]
MFEYMGKLPALSLLCNYKEIGLSKAIKRKNILHPAHKHFITYQLFKVSYYLHSAEAIHRNLKPSNVLTDCMSRKALRLRTGTLKKQNLRSGDGLLMGVNAKCPLESMWQLNGIEHRRSSSLPVTTPRMCTSGLWAAFSGKCTLANSSSSQVSLGIRFYNAKARLMTVPRPLQPLVDDNVQLSIQEYRKRLHQIRIGHRSDKASDCGANLVYAYDSSHTVTNQIKANGRLCTAGTTSTASSYAVSNVMLCGRPNQRQSDHPERQKATRIQSSRLK